MHPWWLALSAPGHGDSTQDEVVKRHYYRMRHWSMPKMAKNLGLFAARG